MSVRSGRKCPMHSSNFIFISSFDCRHILYLVDDDGMRRRQPQSDDKQVRDSSSKSTTDLEDSTSSKMSRFPNAKPMDIATTMDLESGNASSKPFSIMPRTLSQRRKLLYGALALCLVWIVHPKGKVRPKLLFENSHLVTNFHRSVS